MKVTNVTKGVVLAEKAVIAGTVFKRLKGLLGRKELASSEALILKPCNSIHTFFMRFPIDVLFVDKNHKTIAAVAAMPAFRVSKIYFNAAYVVELPAGIIKSTPVSSGDLLKIE